MELVCEFVETYGGYRCTVTSPEVIEPNKEIKSISNVSNWRSGKTNADVTEIAFSCAAHFIPRGLDVFFPNVKVLKMINCGLQSICREDLSQFKNLEMLYLHFNQLTNLPDDLFEDTPKLSLISFCGNKIESASSKIFKPIINNKFKYIDFSENPKINAIYAPGVYRSVSSVTELMAIIDSSCLIPIDNFLPSSEASSDDSFTVSNESFTGNFENLLTSGKFSDFVIIVNKLKRFNVHKLILATQSEGFAEMFEKDPKAVEMTIDDLSQETVEEFLRYLYTGKLQNFADKSLEMFALASRIKVKNLKKSMEEFAISQLDQSNAFKAFSLAHSYESEKLKSAAFKEIQKNFPDKTLPESWVNDLPKVKKSMEAKETYDKIFKQLQNL